MDAELKAKWIEALRSGNYQQGSGTLRAADKETYCCLGVLCHVAGLPFVDDGFLDDGKQAIPSISYLPLKFSLRAKVTDGQQDELTALNDSGDSFSKIADFIEVNL